MSRNGGDSDLGYFILDTIICNLISLNVLRGDVKHHGVSSSSHLHQICCMLPVFVSGCIFLPRVATVAVVPCLGPVPSRFLRSFSVACFRVSENLEEHKLLWADTVKY